MIGCRIVIMGDVAGEDKVTSVPRTICLETQEPLYTVFKISTD